MKRKQTKTNLLQREGTVVILTATLEEWLVLIYIQFVTRCYRDGAVVKW